LKAVLPAMARRSAVLEMLETAIVIDGRGWYGWMRERKEVR
jgi:hypothetical protein